MFMLNDYYHILPRGGPDRPDLTRFHNYNGWLDPWKDHGLPLYMRDGVSGTRYLPKYLDALCRLLFLNANLSEDLVCQRLSVVYRDKHLREKWSTIVSLVVDLDWLGGYALTDLNQYTEELLADTEG